MPRKGRPVEPIADTTGSVLHEALMEWIHSPKPPEGEPIIKANPLDTLKNMLEKLRPAKSYPHFSPQEGATTDKFANPENLSERPKHPEQIKYEQNYEYSNLHGMAYQYAFREKMLPERPPPSGATTTILSTRTNSFDKVR